MRKKTINKFALICLCIAFDKVILKTILEIILVRKMIPETVLISFWCERRTAAH
jgi:hypothetical protein